MIKVTDSAIQGINDHFDGKDPQPIRVYLADGGCSGPQLSLAIDELRDGDKSQEQGSLTFLINGELADATGQVTIDMSEYGFTIDSENVIGGGCGCASSGGGCGSGSGCGC